MSEYLRAGNNQERMILHHLGPSWCASAIARYEARSGRAFDLVVYARPDLVWWQPVVPWCELRWREQIIACHEPGCDMAWIAPRRAAEHISMADSLSKTRPLASLGILSAASYGYRRAAVRENVLTYDAFADRTLLARFVIATTLGSQPREHATKDQPVCCTLTVRSWT